MSRRPLLPRDFGTHNIGTDWKTGDVVQDVVEFRGKLWDPYKVRHDHDGVDQDRDRERVRRNRSVSRFLGSQRTDPGV